MSTFAQPLSNRRLSSILWILLIALTLTSCANKRTIVNQLTEKEANEIIVFLARRGLEATKVKADTGQAGGGASAELYWDIQVDSSEATSAMAILNQAGLPRRRGQNLLKIFGETGLVPSEMQEKVRYQAGLAETLASTIRKMDGIIDADVQLSFPEEDILNPEANKDKQVTASVYVKHSGIMDDPNSHLETKIRRLVASSVNGLDFKNVTVVADRARYQGDTTLIGNDSLGQQRDYVSVWTVVVAKDSVTRFRLIFFSMTMSILILALMVAWMMWKVLPVLQLAGGFRQILSLAPITPAVIRGAAEGGSGEEEEEEEEEEE